MQSIGEVFANLIALYVICDVDLKDPCRIFARDMKYFRKPHQVPFFKSNRFYVLMFAFIATKDDLIMRGVASTIAVL